MSQTPGPARQILQRLIEKIIENKRQVIAITVFAVVLAGVAVAAKKSETISRFLASVSNGTSSSSTPAQSNSAKGLASQADLNSYQECTFETALKPETGKVLFKEIAWMGDKQSPNNEWLALEKAAAGDLDASGYQILNENQKIKIVLPAKTILTDAKPLYVLARKDGISGITADGTYSGALRNANEGLRLFSNDCRLLDEVFASPNWPAGSNLLKETMKRDLATLKWFDLSHPLKTLASAEKSLNKTLAKTNSLPAPSTGQAARAVVANGSTTILTTQQEQVLIGLITIGIKGNSNDSYIELYNPGAAPVDLAGWSVKKKNSAGVESTLVSAPRLSGKSIAGGGYFLLAIQTGYAGTTSPDVIWPPSYQLAYKNNTITIYNKSGRVIDTAAWTDIPEGKSLARVSWESNQFVVVDIQAPKNASGN